MDLFSAQLTKHADNFCSGPGGMVVEGADDVELSSTLALVDSGRSHFTFRLRHVSQPI